MIPLRNRLARSARVAQAAGLLALLIVAVYLTRANWVGAGVLSRGAPEVSVDESVDLGEIDLGDQAVATFVVRNLGSGPLVVLSATGSCRCQAVFARDQSGAEMSVSGLTIEPGAEATLGVRFITTGQLGEKNRFPIYISTNDPTNRVAAVGVSYTPTAKLYCVPRTLVFGNVGLDSDSVAAVELFADDRADKVLPGPLECSPNGLFSARFIPNSNPSTPDILGNSRALKIGRLEVTLRGSRRAQNVDQDLQLCQGGRSLLRIPISARIENEFHFTPDVITLPRRSSGGEIWHVTVLCRSRAGDPFTLRLESASAGLTFTPKSEGSQAVHVLDVAYTGDIANSKPLARSAKFVASSSSKSADVRLDVFVRPDENSR